VGPSAKNGVPSVGRRHRLLCADGQAWRSAKAGQLGFQRGQQGQAFDEGSLFVDGPLDLAVGKGVQLRPPPPPPPPPRDLVGGKLGGVGVSAKRRGEERRGGHETKKLRDPHPNL
jgi:hypothetical protein